MAVRLSYALGLHRVETQRVYDESERTSISVPRSVVLLSVFLSSINSSLESSSGEVSM
jgi:hypothetical protein